ncbi:MAG TPA: hypothetical protein EYQ07_00230 [Candidatus Poseidoniales archaeon]|nr:hypothetical protein [Candidatus Poseidoniales archaeon]HIL49454.1 hypothetical protein [Candidatus Poseidoniales archaeon]
MGENGMHSKKAGGRHRRLPATHPSRAMIKIGFAGLRRRAKLSNAVGYSPRDAPRPQRGMESLRESNQGSIHNPHQDLDKRDE